MFCHLQALKKSYRCLIWGGWTGRTLLGEAANAVQISFDNGDRSQDSCLSRPFTLQGGT